MKKKISLLIREEGGAITVMAVIMMVAFLGILAVVIDLGHLHTVQGELRNAADACALRGARAFLPDDLNPTGPQAVDPDPVRAKDEAQITIEDNKSDNTAFQTTDLPLGDIQVGIWDYVNRTLLAWDWPPPSSMWGQYIGPGISLPTRRDDSVSQGPVSMTLANIFGISQVFVNTNATAALSGVGGFKEDGGKPDFPIVIRKDVIEMDKTIDLIFGNANTDNAGWSNLRPISENNHTDANDLKQWFQGTAGPGEIYPPNNIVNLNNGVVCSATKTLIDQQGINLDPPLYLVEATGDNSPGDYYNEPYSSSNKAYVPDETKYPTQADIPTYTFAVTELDAFNQWHAIGAVSAQVLVVWDAPDCTMRIKFMSAPTAIPGTYSGGPWFGVLSTEPKLVQ